MLTIYVHTGARRHAETETHIDCIAVNLHLDKKDSICLHMNECKCVSVPKQWFHFIDILSKTKRTGSALPNAMNRLWARQNRIHKHWCEQIKTKSPIFQMKIAARLMVLCHLFLYHWQVYVWDICLNKIKSIRGTERKCTDSYSRTIESIIMLHQRCSFSPKPNVVCDVIEQVAKIHKFRSKYLHEHENQQEQKKTHQ